ncbi:hypothetical protein [Methylocapsa palsarum]|jgi:hypothetical protein|uniref:Uncharacterized protein n=1 Tax=Methylocapsa palsarum TaxID=1612308 RepID=A0A1I3YG83_9HYPH|nr:hypothetical protein [Methylocapsa palsarum]SFK30291.1 hypothetical protein SAMN05444581_105220 [Methylocapsa palsarum]
MGHIPASAILHQLHLARERDPNFGFREVPATRSGEYEIFCSTLDPMNGTRTLTEIKTTDRNPQTREPMFLASTVQKFFLDAKVAVEPDFLKLLLSEVARGDPNGVDPYANPYDPEEPPTFWAPDPPGDGQVNLAIPREKP